MADQDVLARMEHRIGRLERQNRRLRGAVIGTFAVMALLGLAGFRQMQERVVRAQKFELLNAEGQAVSEWTTERHGPVLRLGRLYEPHTVVGTFTAGNPGLTVIDEGRSRVTLGLDGDADATMLLLSGPEPVGQGTSSGVALMHIPRYGPVLTMQEAGRTVFTTRPETGRRN